jgi:predicted nucleotidyltransferase
MSNSIGSTDHYDRYLEEITFILRHALENAECRVYLFGSRAEGRHSDTSDFDVAVLASTDVSRELGIAREMLEASKLFSD